MQGRDSFTVRRGAFQRAGLQRSFAVACAIALLLSSAACGGGGGGSSASAPAATPTQSGPEFALASAYNTYALDASTTNFTATGACVGSAAQSHSATSPTTFQNMSALAVSQTLTSTDCPGLASMRTLYYDGSGAQVGFSISGGEYGVAQTPLVLPTQVQAGASGTLGTFSVYTDSTEATSAGSLVVTYDVTSLGSTSVLVSFTKKSYSTANVLVETDIYSYQLTTQAVLTTSTINYVTAGIVLAAS